MSFATVSGAVEITVELKFQFDGKVGLTAVE